MSKVVEIQELRFDSTTHIYWYGLEQFASVTSVLRQLLPIKKSFDGVSQAVLDHARERGILVDKYCCEFAGTGHVEIPADERLDVIERVEHFVKWWTTAARVDHVQTQMILADRTHGIAGTADLVGLDTIVDIKCTWQAEVEWEYQLGAYAYMWSMEHAGSEPELAVLHINPKKYRDGLKVIRYDTAQAIQKWTNLLAFYRDVKPFLKNGQTDAQDH